MDGFTKKIDELREEQEKYEKDYMNYLEADMNKEARRAYNKMHKIEDEINKLIEKREYGLKEDMKKKIEQYKKFINKKGLTYEFDNFAQEEEEEEDCL